MAIALWTSPTYVIEDSVAASDLGSPGRRLRPRTLKYIVTVILSYWDIDI